LNSPIHLTEEHSPDRPFSPLAFLPRPPVRPPPKSQEFVNLPSLPVIPSSIFLDGLRRRPSTFLLNLVFVLPTARFSAPPGRPVGLRTQTQPQAYNTLHPLQPRHSLLSERGILRQLCILSTKQEEESPPHPLTIRGSRPSDVRSRKAQNRTSHLPAVISPLDLDAWKPAEYAIAVFSRRSWDPLDFSVSENLAPANAHFPKASEGTGVKIEG
jgi:hypothetical protein